MVLKLTCSKLTLVNGLSFLLDPFIQLARISSNFSSIFRYESSEGNKTSFIIIIFSYIVLACNIVNLCITYIWSHLQNEILTIISSKFKDPCLFLIKVRLFVRIEAFYTSVSICSPCTMFPAFLVSGDLRGFSMIDGQD